MLQALLRTLVRWWETDTAPEEIRDIDVIVAISYSTLRKTLVEATYRNLIEAIALQKTYAPYAAIVFANCSYTFPGAENVEKRLKERVLRDYGAESWLSALRSMRNSIEEARVIKETFSPAVPSRILVVTGEMHSRSVRYIWERTFPDAEILVWTIPYRHEYQPDQLIFFQRHGPWAWLLANVLRQTLIHLLGLDRVANMHHGTGSIVPSFGK